MTIKEKVIQAVQAFPDDASIEGAMERLLFLAKVDRGLEQAVGDIESIAEFREKCDFCDGTDLNKNSSVDWYDLAEFVEVWLLNTN